MQAALNFMLLLVLRANAERRPRLLWTFFEDIKRSPIRIKKILKNKEIISRFRRVLKVR